MTSLARQLEGLAVPHTQSALGLDKRRASLLFDPKEAANLDRETVFALGISGLEELGGIDSLFEEFESTLFNKNSTDWERSLQSQEVNKQLDATIQRFLITLSPYFLLKSAQKALEWLLYRYHIHEYNKDDVILCVLPYHDSKIFVRLLQVMDLKNPSDKWHWLQSSAKHGASLARSTLCNHCRKDPGFLAFMCDLLPKFINIHGPSSSKLRAIIGLYTCAILGILQVKEDINEKIMSVLVPTLVQGIKSKCVDYTAATYMILSQLAVQTNLKNELLCTLLPVITKKVKPSLTLEVLACLSLLFQTQKITELPKKSFKHLSRVPGLVHLLGNLASRYNVTSFLQAYLTRLLPCAVHSGNADTSGSEDSAGCAEGPPQYGSILTSVIQTVPMTDEIAARVAKQLLEALVEKRRTATDVESVENWAQITKTLLTAVQNKYGEIMDTAVESVLSKHKKNPVSMEILQEMTSLTLVPAKYQQISSGKTLLLTLNHADVSTRRLAVRHVVTQLQDSQMEADDFIVRSLVDRLADDAPAVVEEVLKLDTMLCLLLKETDLWSAVTSLIQCKYTGLHRQEWHSVALGCVEILSHMLVVSPHLAAEVCTLLLPYTLILNGHQTHQIQFAKKIVALLPKCAPSMAVSSSLKDLLQGYGSETKLKSDDICALNDLIVKVTATWLNNMGPEKAVDIFITPVMKLIVTQQNNIAAFFLLRVVMEMMSVARTRDHIVCMATHGVAVLRSVTVHPGEMNKSAEDICTTQPLGHDDVSQALACLEKHSSVSAIVYFSSLNVVLKKIASIDNNEVWLTRGDAHTGLVVDVLELLMYKASCSDEHRNTWTHFLTHFTYNYLTSDYLLRLCGCIWLDEGVSPLLHVGSYHLLANWFRTFDFNEDLVLRDASPFLAILVSALCHKEQSVRSASLLCMKTLRRRTKDHVHAAILKKFVKQEDEIEADATHAQQSLGVLFAVTEDNPTEEVSKYVASRRVTLTYLLKVIGDDRCPALLQERLLRLLSEVPHQFVLDASLPLGVKLLECVKDARANETTYAILAHIINRFDESSAAEMTEESARIHFLISAVQTLAPSQSETPSQIHALKQIDKSFFNALSSVTVQQRIVTSLVDVAVSSMSVTCLNTCMHTLKHVRLEAVHVQHELQPAPQDAATVKARKRTRTQETRAILNYNRVKVVLEALQTRSKVTNSHHMTAVLFGVLKSLLSLDHEEVEYCKQLVLSSLHNCCTKWTVDTKPENEESISVELLVQCIRSSMSPQTQQQALLVMAAVAHLFPEYILHHAMSIFTFMGDRLLHQDDSHTFQVITNTLNTLIPALVKAHGETQSASKLHSLLTDILQVFVTARHHIPKHRCHVLFHTLMNTVGAEEYTWVLMLLIVESSVRSKDVPSLQEVDDIMQQDMSTIDRDLEFVCQISEKFDVSTQLHSAICVLKLLQQLTLFNDNKRAPGHLSTRDKHKKASALHPLTLSTLSAQQLRLIEYHCARLVAELLSRSVVISQIVEELEREGNASFKGLLQSFVQECLSLVTMVAKAFGANSNTTSVKFWRALLGKVYDILEKVNIVLPTPIFLHVISALMSHPQLTVRKKCLDLLSTKLQQLDSSVLTPDEVESLLAVVDRLCTILGESDPREAELMGQVKQLSLYSLRLLCKMLAPQQPQRFTKLFGSVIELIKSSAVSPMLGGALMCLGELCASLKAYAVPALATLMPVLLPILSDLEIMKKSETLLVCALTATQKILSSLSHFLSHYLKDILQAICCLSTLVPADVPAETSNKNHPTARMRNVKHHMAVGLGPRMLLTVVTLIYEHLLTQQAGGIGCLLDILKQHIEHISREDLSAHNALLLSIFIRVLDVRNQPNLGEHMTGIEDLCIEGLLSMVVRLSEMTFRPLYYKLYNWACVEGSMEARHRKLTFFKLSTRLSGRLKSLFNIFVGHSIKIACQLLQDNNSSVKDVDYYGDGELSEGKSCELVVHIVAMLHSCFQHDTEGFVTKEIFNTLAKPLVNQLENTIGGELVYESRISDHVAPCVTQLAVAVRDDVSCKTLNYQICLKTRHDSPKVRYAALGCVEQLAQKLGVEYMTLLPETIPFLAELMEDESEDVEQQCQHVVSSLEQLLGEPLKKYF